MSIYTHFYRSHHHSTLYVVNIEWWLFSTTAYFCQMGDYSIITYQYIFVSDLVTNSDISISFHTSIYIYETCNGTTLLSTPFVFFVCLEIFVFQTSFKSDVNYQLDLFQHWIGNSIPNICFAFFTPISYSLWVPSTVPLYFQLSLSTFLSLSSPSP